MKKIFLSLAIVFFLIAAFSSNSWAPNFCIDIEKEVSIDGGATWHDADTPIAAPQTAVGEGVEYRLIVNNCGSVDLENVTINDADDAELGIVDFSVGNLAVGESIELYSGDIPQLNQPERCDDIGEKQNIAHVSGSSSGNVVEDKDPAWVKCLAPPQSCIDIEKLISVDGGITWHDADTEVEAVETEVDQGAQYKLIVNNCGSVDLENVTINDAELGIVDFSVGNLAVGESIELDNGDIPQLNQPERCAESGTFENIAGVDASSVSDGSEVTDSDPAWVSCLERGDEGCTPGYWKQAQHWDSWYNYGPANGFFDVFERTITIKWSMKVERPLINKTTLLQANGAGKPLPTENPTLLQALQANGGGINALARHAVAALLNASSPNVSYPYTVDEVIEMTKAAIDSESFNATKDLFETANEAGCPLN